MTNTLVLQTGQRAALDRLTNALATLNAIGDSRMMKECTILMNARDGYPVLLPDSARFAICGDVRLVENKWLPAEVAHPILLSGRTMKSLRSWIDGTKRPCNIDDVVYQAMRQLHHAVPVKRDG